MAIPRKSVARSRTKPAARKSSSRSQSSTRDSEGLETRVDSKTGKSYSVIPKVRLDESGTPIRGTGLNADDLQAEADRFLAPLRVPVDKNEQKAIAAERERLAKEQARERADYLAQVESKHGKIEEPTEIVAEKRGFFARIFGNKD